MTKRLLTFALLLALLAVPILAQSSGSTQQTNAILRDINSKLGGTLTLSGAVTISSGTVSLDQTTTANDVDVATIAAGTNVIGAVTQFAALADYLSATSNVTTTTEVDIVAANASYRYWITSITVYNSSATDTLLNVYENGSGGTLLYVAPAPAKGGVAIAFPTPIPLSAVNKKITIDEAATADAVYVTITYFRTAS